MENGKNGEYYGIYGIEGVKKRKFLITVVGEM
jgi:hypothetical protein